MTDADGARVELTDLDVITRYSLAVRSATADRDELIATLRSDLAWLEGGVAATRTSAARTTATKAPTRKATAKKTAARKSAARKSASR